MFRDLSLCSGIRKFPLSALQRQSIAFRLRSHLG